MTQQFPPKVPPETYPPTRHALPPGVYECTCGEKVGPPPYMMRSGDEIPEPGVLLQHGRNPEAVRSFPVELSARSVREMQEWIDSLHADEAASGSR